MKANLAIRQLKSIKMRPHGKDCAFVNVPRQQFRCDCGAEDKFKEDVEKFNKLLREIKKL